MVNVFVVFAHSEKTSLNAAINDITVNTLRGQGHDVVVSDLYAMKFNPLLGRHDITGEPNDAANFRYSQETLRSWADHRVAPDIVVEQKKLDKADLVVFQFPLYWMGFPAILKGWFDRVFMQGFAFGPDRMFDQGYLKDKKAIFSMTIGGPREWYTDTGPNGDIEVSLWPLQNNILRFVGFDVLSPHIAFGMDFATAENCKPILKAWEGRLHTLLDEEPLSFVPMSGFRPIYPAGPMQGYTLRQEELDKAGLHTGISIGQHLGRPLPTGNMFRPNDRTHNAGLTTNHLARNSPGCTADVEGKL